MLNLIRRVLKRVFDGPRCPDCGHVQTLHGGYGCLYTDLDRHPYAPCDCVRIFEE